MTFFQSVTAMQSPFEERPDGNWRAQFSFNVLCTKEHSASLLEELGALLEQQDVGVLGATIFLGLSQILPAGPGPFLFLAETGGTAPLQRHNSFLGHDRSTVKIVARAGEGTGFSPYEAARALIYRAFDTLTTVRNVEVIAS